MHPDLLRKVGDDSDVVVPEHELHGQSSFQELGEEIEDDGPQRGRGPDDRMFRVTGDDDRVAPSRTGDLEKPLREQVGRSLGRPQGPLGRAAETEVEVRDDESSRAGSPGRFEDEGRRIGDGP